MPTRSLPVPPKGTSTLIFGAQISRITNHALTRTQDYYATNSVNWNSRKLSRVLAQRAVTASMVSSTPFFSFEIEQDLTLTSLHSDFKPL